MAPVNPGSYLFRKESITDLRQRLELSQAQMAERIGVPKNTVSRWETGATTPDADSLAAVYSLGKERGVAISFFTPAKQPPVKQPPKARDVALVYWDLSNAGVFPWWTLSLEQCDTFITQEVRELVPHADREIYRAFSPDSYRSAQLKELGWRVPKPEPLTFSVDWTRQVYEQALSDLGKAPDASVVFLVTSNTKHVDTIEELRERRAHVYLIAPANVDASLIAAVSKRRFIPLP